MQSVSGGKPCTAEATKSARESGDKILLVEGSDDCHFVDALCRHFGLAGRFEVVIAGGEDNLLREFNALVTRSPLPLVVGMMRDAESDRVAKWSSIRDKLKRYKYSFPDQPDIDGTILNAPLNAVSELPKIGFWIMPNNRDVGMLEDFCLDMLDLRHQTIVKTVVEQAKQDGITTFREVHRAKAEIHTYLAWQDEPRQPLGQAITKQILRPQTDTARAFADWLKRLFD